MKLPLWKQETPCFFGSYLRVVGSLVGAPAAAPQGTLSRNDLWSRKPGPFPANTSLWPFDFAPAEGGATQFYPPPPCIIRASTSSGKMTNPQLEHSYQTRYKHTVRTLHEAKILTMKCQTSIQNRLAGLRGQASVSSSSQVKCCAVVACNHVVNSR